MKQELSGAFQSGAMKGLSRFKYVGIPMCLWICLGFIPSAEAVFENGNMFVAVILYLLGLPLSVIFKVDTGFGSITNPQILLLIGLIVVGLNFILIYAIRGWLKEAGSKREKQ